jgi:hypothetical protein
MTSSRSSSPVAALTVDPEGDFAVGVDAVVPVVVVGVVACGGSGLGRAW